jgi:cytoskeletal protein RodZ
MSEAHKKVGEKLKAQREKLNLSLEDVSEDTKITVEYLQAIENGEIDSFPSNVYYDMFARSYAKEMEMNPDELFEELKMKAEAAVNFDDAETPPQKAAPESAPKKGNGFSFVKLGAWLGGIIIVIFIVIVVLSITGDKTQETPAVQSEENTVAEDGEPAGSRTEEPEDITSESATQSVDIELPEYEPVKTMSLQVSTRDSCWVMVLADGDTVLNRNLPGGAVRELSAEYRFLVSAGNPNVLDIRLDGRLLRPLSESGRPYRDREINQLNKNEYLAEPEESGLETP